MSRPIIFEDVFEITQIDPDGKKFDRVSRIVSRSDLLALDLTLDVNVEIYPLSPGERLAITVARTLNLDGTPSPDHYDAGVSTAGRPLLSDRFEYVVHGRVFKLKGAKGAGGKAEAFISFGGLLAHVVGDPARVGELGLDDAVFLLAKKV